MSLFSYHASQEIYQTGASFSALIMAAMRRADSDNILILRAAFPEIWEELQARYNAPGGLLGKEVS